MADPQVRRTQQWLNTTYASRAGWVPLEEDGLTGWGTIYGGVLRGALDRGCGRYCGGFYGGAFSNTALHGIDLRSITLHSVSLCSIARQGATLHGAILRGRAGVLGRLFHISPKVVSVVWLSVMSCEYLEGEFLCL